MSFNLVTTLEEVETNIIQFNKDMANNTDIINQLSLFRHWYYVDKIQLFGPSKYIGYKNMNVDKYDRGRGKDGGKTEAVLKKWFVELAHSAEQSESLMIELSSTLLEYDKNVRKNAIIHILK